MEPSKFKLNPLILEHMEQTGKSITAAANELGLDYFDVWLLDQETDETNG